MKLLSTILLLFFCYGVHAERLPGPRKPPSPGGGTPLNPNVPGGVVAAVPKALIELGEQQLKGILDATVKCACSVTCNGQDHTGGQIQCYQVAGQDRAKLSLNSIRISGDVAGKFFMKASADGSSVSTAIEGNEGQANVEISGTIGGPTTELQVQPSLEGAEISCCKGVKTFTAGELVLRNAYVEVPMDVKFQFTGDAQLSGGFLVLGGGVRATITRHYKSKQFDGGGNGNPNPNEIRISIAGLTVEEASGVYHQALVDIATKFAADASADLEAMLTGDSLKLRLMYQLAANVIRHEIDVTAQAVEAAKKGSSAKLKTKMAGFIDGVLSVTPCAPFWFPFCKPPSILGPGGLLNDNTVNSVFDPQ